jgi:hypothetical protein
LKELGVEGNIKVNHKKIGWQDAEWINLAQDRIQWRTLVNVIIKLVETDARNFLGS